MGINHLLPHGSLILQVGGGKLVALGEMGSQLGIDNDGSILGKLARDLTPADREDSGNPPKMPETFRFRKLDSSDTNQPNP